MRQLGHGHSIMWFAPLEVDRRIRSVASKGPSDVIGTADILQWAIRETCDDIEQRTSHWAQQGMDHTSRYADWTSFCRGQLSSEELSAKWLQPEAKRLEDLYGPHKTLNFPLVIDEVTKKKKKTRKKKNLGLLAALDIRQRCIELGVLCLRDVSMDEEQEREVIHEAERERQVERPPRALPATHSIHQAVVDFVQTGVVPTMTTGFCRAFETLDATSAAPKGAPIWCPHIWATTDFQKTVRSSSKVDGYLRPVMWIISGKGAHNEVLVILSPYEANYLLPDIKSSDNVHLHLYTPRITKSMKPCDDLALYSIPAVPAGWAPPPSLMDLLNVFAGQLYLKDYETYIRLCGFLCVYARDLQGEEGIEVACDGFISPNTRPRHLRKAYPFQTSPLDSLRILMGLRRKGMRFAPTHMGKLLDGRLLSEGDFDGGDEVRVSFYLSSHDWVIDD